MGLDDTDAAKDKGNLQSKKQSNKSDENHKKKKKNNGVNNNSKGDKEAEEREASGCWLNFRFMFGCVPSKPDADASSSSSPLYATTIPTGT